MNNDAVPAVRPELTSKLFTLSARFVNAIFVAVCRSNDRNTA